MLEKKELENGYAFKFKCDAKTLKEVNAFIDAERQCCDFFTFDLFISDDKSEAWLSMTGPEGVKDFIGIEMEMLRHSTLLINTESWLLAQRGNSTCMSDAKTQRR